MTQPILPGFEPTNEEKAEAVRVKLRKFMATEYECVKGAHGKKTVSFDSETNTMRCYQCGAVNSLATIRLHDLQGEVEDCLKG